jgi:hypothetical protein
MNRRARALMRADAGRMVADAVLLRPLGDRMMLEYDRAAVRAVEHTRSPSTPATVTTWTC